jgi:hypothetical protein
VGLKVLVPCDLLAFPDYYLPSEEIKSNPVTSNNALTDLVLIYPMIREFTASEFRAGRIPHWQPQNYCGAPFIWPKYSPFEMIYTAFPSPVTLAWMEVMQMLCIGTGTWWFLTRSLKYAFWPAATVSWCMPWIGFIVVWRGFPLTGPVCFLPWLLWSVDLCASHPFARKTLFASLFSALVLISGAPDIAGLVLLTSGLRFLWNAGREHLAGRPLDFTRRSVASMTLCWFAGFLLAAPYLMPFAEFSGTGTRMIARAKGSEERPPVGLHALPGLVMPEIHGGSRNGSPYLGPSGNLLESVAGGYAGLFMVLTVVPMALANHKRRIESLFWLLLALISVGWTIDLPGLVSVLRLPGLNLLSYNRWTFATAFSIFMLGCAGLEYLHDPTGKIRTWFAFLTVVAALFACWCFYSSANLPEPLATILPQAVRAGRLTDESLAIIRSNFSIMFQISGGLSLLSLVSWIVLTRLRFGRTLLTWTIPVVLVAELVWFAAIQIRQCEPSQYYPRVPALQRISECGPGRILGVMCLPPNLNRTHDLSDIRGYDGVDSKYITSLLAAVSDPAASSPRYAATQWYLPQLMRRENGTFYLPPILSMLNTRYLIFRSQPSVDWPLLFHEDDYWVLENPDFLPRTFVPASTRKAVSDDSALRRMTQSDFDPSGQALLHTSTKLPPDGAEGEAKIIQETPGHIVISAAMKSPGLVVLSESWHPGWTATVDSAPAEVLRTNVAICSVMVPAGQHEIVMLYRPSRFSTSLVAAVVGLALTLLPLVHRRVSDASPAKANGNHSALHEFSR